jgi:hypothetical protein
MDLVNAVCALFLLVGTVVLFIIKGSDGLSSADWRITETNNGHAGNHRSVRGNLFLGGDGREVVLEAFKHPEEEVWVNRPVTESDKRRTGYYAEMAPVLEEEEEDARNIVDMLLRMLALPVTLNLQINSSLGPMFSSSSFSLADEYGSTGLKGFLRMSRSIITRGGL